MTDLTFFLLLCCDSAIFTSPSRLHEVWTVYGDTFAAAARAMDSSVKYPLHEIVEDYHASLVNSVMHIVLGSKQWCFSEKLTSPETQDRYEAALIDSFTRCGGTFSLALVEQWADYFEREESEEEQVSDFFSDDDNYYYDTDKMIALSSSPPRERKRMMTATDKMVVLSGSPLQEKRWVRAA